MSKKAKPRKLFVTRLIKEKNGGGKTNLTYDVSTLKSARVFDNNSNSSSIKSSQKFYIKQKTAGMLLVVMQFAPLKFTIFEYN